MPSDDPLLTAMIVRDDEGWTIWWVDTAFFQPGGAFQTLDWLEQATESLLSETGGAFQSLDALLQATDDLVLGRDPRGGGTLQYLIYPWGRPGIGDKRRLPVDVLLKSVFPSTDPVPEPRLYGFYVSGNPGDLRAIDIDRHSLEVHGRTATDLVNHVASLCDDGQHNFIWDRDIRSLRHAD
jgi:hypothetical protein